MKTEMLWNEIFRLKEHGVSESQDARLEEGITGGCGTVCPVLQRRTYPVKTPSYSI